MTLRQRIVACELCPRLVEYRAEIARTKRRAFTDHTYWCKGVPPFGVRSPRLLVVGLAPGAHGANRTGRVFTGDGSGEWLYRAMYETGFSTGPEAVHARDGLRLIDARITNVLRCVPPGNKPVAAELDRCRPYLVEELETYGRLRVVLALGKIAFDSLLTAWPQTGRAPFAAGLKFAHGAEHRNDDQTVTLLVSYHPSRQNTNTGLLTRRAFDAIFRRARSELEA